MREADKFSCVRRELEHWSDAGRIARVWLRDDDAHEPCRPLDELLGRVENAAASCLLAVVPMKAGAALAKALHGQSHVRVAMHGSWHQNHAPPGRKSEETPAERGVATIAAELGAARTRLISHFGPDAGTWYVPPWNRIGVQVAALLPELGFSALSTFTEKRLDASSRLAEINTHLDLMNWKDGRVGRNAADALAGFTTELSRARADGWRPVGVLTHHLVHDENAWAAMDAIIEIVCSHPATAWCHPDDLLEEAFEADRGRAHPTPDGDYRA